MIVEHGRLSCLVGAMLLVGLMALVGCTTDEYDQATRHAELTAAGEDPGEDLFASEVTLFRRYNGKKWMLDKDHEFTVKDESHVKARVTFDQVADDRTYSVHVVWIKPDGKEIKPIRRYYEVTRTLVGLPYTVVPDSTGALPASYLEQLVEQYGEKYGSRLGKRLTKDPEAQVPVTAKVRKKAVDLGYARTSFSLEKDPTFTLDAQLNISTEKIREPGIWKLRVYLDRHLLREIPFTVVNEYYEEYLEDMEDE